MKSKTNGSLEWQEEVSEKRFTWAEARAYAESMGDGWRLPTVQELLTLVDYARRSPACSVFPDCSVDWFWSSSALAGESLNAWNVDFEDGCTDGYDVGNRGRVRLVRDARMP